MKPIKRMPNRWVVRPGAALLQVSLLAVLALGMAGCQAITEGVQTIFTQPTVLAVQASSTDTPYPTRMSKVLEPLPATFTPDPEQPRPTPTQKVALPTLLADFPLFEGAENVAEGTQGDATSAEMTVQTNKSPGSLAALYRQALEGKGWTLRFSETTPVGGFVQEWRKEQKYLTVEYHFNEGKPVVSVDAQVVDSNRALAMLLGFPLPNGSEVLRSGGSTLELYVPQDPQSTIDHFRKQVAAERWRFEAIQPTGWCGSRGCLEVLKEDLNPLVMLEPTPTVDKIQKLETYRVTMPDRTQAEITFLPRRDYTRVYIKINFLDFVRSGIQVSLYPGATITGIFPGVAMFETKAGIREVIDFYEDRMAGMGWAPLDFTVNQPDQYTRSWRKAPHRVVTLTLSTIKGKGIVVGTLNCSTCRDPYYVFPTITPTTAPSR